MSFTADGFKVVDVISERCLIVTVFLHAFSARVRKRTAQQPCADEFRRFHVHRGYLALDCRYTLYSHE